MGRQAGRGPWGEHAGQQLPVLRIRGKTQVSAPPPRSAGQREAWGPGVPDWPPPESPGQAGSWVPTVRGTLLTAAHSCSNSCGRPARIPMGTELVCQLHWAQPPPGPTPAEPPAPARRPLPGLAPRGLAFPLSQLLFKPQSIPPSLHHP